MYTIHMDHLKFPDLQYSTDSHGHAAHEAIPPELKVVQDFLINEINAWEQERKDTSDHHKRARRIIELMARHAEELDIDITSLSENVEGQIQEAAVDEIAMLEQTYS